MYQLRFSEDDCTSRRPGSMPMRTVAGSVSVKSPHRFVAPNVNLYENRRGLDWVAIERAANQELPPSALRYEEKWAGVEWLLDQDVPWKVIELLMGVHDRQIRRWLAKREEEQAGEEAATAS